MSKKKKKGKGINYTSMKCPYCGSTVTYKSADEIYKNNSKGMMLYVCSRYPACDAYVRTHLGTRVPVGTMANGQLRRLRFEAHLEFNKLYESGMMSKDEAYRWLALITYSPQTYAHIGNMGEYYCKVVIDESKKLYQTLSERRGSA